MPAQGDCQLCGYSKDRNTSRGNSEGKKKFSIPYALDMNKLPQTQKIVRESFILREFVSFSWLDGKVIVKGKKVYA